MVIALMGFVRHKVTDEYRKEKKVWRLMRNNKGQVKGNSAKTINSKWQRLSLKAETRPVFGAH